MAKLDSTLPDAETLLIQFYNHDGLIWDEFTRLSRVLTWNDDEWEECHHFIQWVFPTNEPSKYNPNAPLLTKHVARWIDKRKLLASFDRFMEFLGFDYDNTLLDYRPRYGRVRKWYEPGNHNLLRVTRVLKCMMLCGCYLQARELEVLLHRTKNYARLNGWEDMPQETWDHWNAALMYDGLFQSEFDA